MAVAFCPECGEGVKLGSQPHEGQRVTCNECGASLEVISLKPLELDWVYDEPVEDSGEWEGDWGSDEDLEEDWASDEPWPEDTELEDGDEPEQVEWEGF